jgi:hypothetical protein
MLRVCDRAGSRHGSQLSSCVVLLSGKEDTVSILKWLFRGSMAGLSFPLSTLRPAPHDALRMTRGQDDLLFLSCIELSSTISCQLVLAHPPPLPLASARRFAERKGIPATFRLPPAYPELVPASLHGLTAPMLHRQSRGVPALTHCVRRRRRRFLQIHKRSTGKWLGYDDYRPPHVNKRGRSGWCSADQRPLASRRAMPACIPAVARTRPSPGREWRD